LIHRRVNLVLTRGNRKGGGGRQKIKISASFLFEVSCSQRRVVAVKCDRSAPASSRPCCHEVDILEIDWGRVYRSKEKKKKKRPNPLVSPCSRLARYSCSYRSGLILLRGALSASLSSAAAACCLFLCGPNLFSHLAAFTETNKQSPNTGARANNTLHK